MDAVQTSTRTPFSSATRTRGAFGSLDCDAKTSSYIGYQLWSSCSDISEHHAPSSTTREKAVAQQGYIATAQSGSVLEISTSSQLWEARSLTLV